MNAKALKIIAVITMTIDHVGLYLLAYDSPGYIACRIIGRIAFPLFAFMIAEGFYHTRNVNKYFCRLLGYCLAIELGFLGFYLVSGDNYLLEMNVIWPLLLGLASLMLLSRPQWYLKLLVIVILIGSELLNLAYGAYGIGLIIVFGIYRNFRVQALMLILLNLFFLDWPLLEPMGLGELAKYGWLQWFSVVALLPRYFYNGQPGKLSKWFFYVYYPAHLGVIYILSLII